MTDSSTMPTPDPTMSHDEFVAATDAHLAAQGDDDPAPVGWGQDHGSQAAQGPHSRREATYRIRAREAEAAVRALEERVTRLQTAEVQRLAAQLHDPANLWQHVELVELLNEDGEVDPERVAEAVAALADSKSHLLRPPPRTPGFAQGRRTPVDQGSSVTWGAVLRGRD
jgi:hypothetical protein